MGQMRRICRLLDGVKMADLVVGGEPPEDVEMRVYAQKCGKIEVEIEIEAEIEGNRTFGPDVVWLTGVRSSGGF